MRLFLLLFLLTSLMTCTRQVSQGQRQLEPHVLDRNEIRKVISSGKEHFIVYGNENEYAYSLHDIAKDLSKGGVFRNVSSIASDSLSKAGYKSKLIELVGSPASNKWTNEVLSAIGIRLVEKGLYLENRFIPGESLLILLNWYPNPLNPEIPIKMITGQTDDVIIEHFKELFSSGSTGSMGSYDLEVYENGQRLAFAYFDSKWEIDQATLNIVEIQEDVLGSANMINYSGESSFPLDSRLELWDSTINRIELFFKTRLTKGIDVKFYPSPEKKALLTKRMDESHLKLQTIHSIHSDVYSSWIPTLWIEELLRKNDLVSNEQLLRPTALYLNAFWNGIDLADIQPRFARDFDLEWIFRLRNSNESEYLQDLLTYQYINEIIERNKSAFLAMLKEKTIDFSKFNFVAINDSIGTRTEYPSLPVLKGYNFAHEGYAIHDGYGSKKATVSLDSMLAAGSNTMAINPYSFMKNPRSTGAIPVVNGPNMENDESVIHSIKYAQSIGMKTILKPHIWLTGSWPGEIGFSSEEKWKLWLKEYKSWILHFAILAEISDVDVFCIGTELKRVTLEKPGFWRDLILDIRSVYSGQLTYAANWGEEFENISFWKDLDYIGCDAYYPLSASQDPNISELQEGVASMFSKFSKVHKQNNDLPIILTEIGYPNLAEPWINPHSEKGDPDPHFEQQAKCVQTVADFIESENPDYLRGVIWWKWPSYLRYRDRRNVSFTIYDSPAEDIIEDLFIQMSD